MVFHHLSCGSWATRGHGGSPLLIFLTFTTLEKLHKQPAVISANFLIRQPFALHVSSPISPVHACIHFHHPYLCAHGSSAATESSISRLTDARREYVQRIGRYQEEKSRTQPCMCKCLHVPVNKVWNSGPKHSVFWHQQPGLTFSTARPLDPDKHICSNSPLAAKRPSEALKQESLPQLINHDVWERSSGSNNAANSIRIELP